MSENALFTFPLRDIDNVHCWLATLPEPKFDKQGARSSNAEQTLGVLDFLVDIKKSNLNLTCKNCTGSKWSEFTNLLLENEKAASVAILTLLDFAIKFIKSELLPDTIDQALYDAHRLCPHSPHYKPSSKKSTHRSMGTVQTETSRSLHLGLFIVCITLAFLVLVINLTTKSYVRRRHRKGLEGRSPQQLVALYLQQQEKKQMNVELNESTTSMFCSPAIPVWIRFGMPLAILGNIGFFLSGQLSIGASVTIMVSLGGETIRSDDFYSLSLATTAIKIWNGKSNG